MICILQMRKLRQGELNNFPQVTQPELKSKLTREPTHLAMLCYSYSIHHSHLLQEASRVLILSVLGALCHLP